MDWHYIEDNWKQLTAAAKHNWDKLNDMEFQQIAGKREPLISRIQGAYGITRREADKQVWDWGKSMGRTGKKLA